MLLQNNRRERSELLSTFDCIYFILYIGSAGVCEQTSVSKSSRAKLGSTTSNTADSIML